MKDDFSTMSGLERPLKFLDEPKQKSTLSLIGEEKLDYDPKPEPILNRSRRLQYYEEIRNLSERQGGYYDAHQAIFDIWYRDPLYVHASNIAIMATSAISASLIHDVYGVPLFNTSIKLPDILNGLASGHNIDNMGAAIASL